MKINGSLRSFLFSSFRLGITEEVLNPSKLKAGIIKVVRKTRSNIYNMAFILSGLNISGRNRVSIINMKVGIRSGCSRSEVVLARIFVTIVLF